MLKNRIIELGKSKKVILVVFILMCYRGRNLLDAVRTKGNFDVWLNFWKSQPCEMNARTLVGSSHPLRSWSSKDYSFVSSPVEIPPKGLHLTIEAVKSTMDVSKELAKFLNSCSEESDQPYTFAVSAINQLNGRGTNGRKWIGREGNIFLTVAISSKRVPIPISLIPLRIGSIIASLVDEKIVGGTVTLKWPNDVLIDGKKVAGVLIESEFPYFLIGIGINVNYAPDIDPHAAAERGRKATCLSDFSGEYDQNSIQSLARQLSFDIFKWSSGSDTKEQVIAEWKKWVDWSQTLEVRDDSIDLHSPLNAGRRINPLDVCMDGTLRVEDPETKKEHILSVEYLL